MAFKFDHYSKEVFHAIRRFLDKKHLYYHASEILGLIQLDLPTDSMIRRVDLRINVKNDSYTVRALSSVSADPKDAKSMARLAEYLTRVNYRLRNGNFEMDYRDGELAFKCYVDCHGGVPVQEAIDDSIFCPPAMFHQYGNGILQVMGVDPAQALEDCEARLKEEKEEAEDAEEDSEDAVDDSSASRVLQDIDPDPDLTASIGSVPDDPATLDRLLDRLLASFQPSEGDGTIIDVTDLDSETDDAAPADGEAEDEAEDDDQAEDAEEAYADEEDDEAYGDEEDDNED